jgi:acetyl-CoA synthetase
VTNGYNLDAASDNNAEIMDAEDPCLFYTLLVQPENQRDGTYQQDIWFYSAYTFKNVFNYEDNDIFWCTADIGWITGLPYIL